VSTVPEPSAPSVSLIVVDTVPSAVGR
jgi:hypothetical protein